VAFTFAGQYTEAMLATGSGGATLLPALTVHVYTVGTTTHVDALHVADEGLDDREPGDDGRERQPDVLRRPWPVRHRLHAAGWVAEAGHGHESAIGGKLKRLAARAYLANSIERPFHAAPPAITTDTLDLDATLTKTYAAILRPQVRGRRAAARLHRYPVAYGGRWPAGCVLPARLR
jgi:hypothetical protein